MRHVYYLFPDQNKILHLFILWARFHGTSYICTEFILSEHRSLVSRSERSAGHPIEKSVSEIAPRVLWRWHFSYVWRGNFSSVWMTTLTCEDGNISSVRVATLLRRVRKLESEHLIPWDDKFSSVNLASCGWHVCTLSAGHRRTHACMPTSVDKLSSTITCMCYFLTKEKILLLLHPSVYTQYSLGPTKDVSSSSKFKYI